MSTLSTLGNLKSDGKSVFINGVENVSEARHIYSIVHEALMDSHIPIAKPIGFKLSHSSSSSGGVLKSMHTYSVETLPEVMTNISKLIIKDWFCTDSHMLLANIYKIPVKVMLPKRGRTSADLWGSTFKEPVIIDENTVCKYPGNDGASYEILNKNQFLFTSLKNGAVLELCVLRSTGYLPMEYAYSKKWETDLTGFFNVDNIFYFNTDFSLMDFVRIKPLDIHYSYSERTHTLTLPLKFMNGLTPNDFEALWKRMLEDTSSHNYEWLMRKTGGKES